MTGAAPDSSASVHFGSVFNFFAALLRFLLMTVTLDTAGRSMWDVPLPEGSPHAAGPVDRSGGHARRLRRMYNYVFTLLEVEDGKKVRAHVLRLVCQPKFRAWIAPRPIPAGRVINLATPWFSVQFCQLLFKAIVLNSWVQCLRKSRINVQPSSV